LLSAVGNVYSVIASTSTDHQLKFRVCINICGSDLGWADN
jgi:hypothetical protein